MKAENSCGGRIRAKRRELDFTQEKLSEDSNISVSRISRIENDLSELTSGEIERICKALRVSADYIIFGEETTSDSLTSEEVKIFRELVQKLQNSQLF